MMTAEALAELRDWHLPDPVSWWPPAFGWWLVAVLILIALIVARSRGWQWQHWPRRTVLQRAARRELAQLQRELETSGDRRRYLAAVSRLLRRLALAQYPAAQVAGLTGEAWLAFLDATGGAGAFSDGVGRVLIEAAYRPDLADDCDIEPVAALVERWVKMR